MATQRGGKKKAGKRTYGRGVSVFFREEENRWICSIKLPNGKYKQVAGAVGASYKEVEAKFDEAIAQVKGGKCIGKSTQKLADYMQTWIEDKSMELKPGTYQTWKNNIDVHIIADPLGERQLQRLAKSEVQVWVNRKWKSLSASTVRKLYAIVHLALEEDAIENGIIASNPCKGVRLPRLPDTEMQFFDQGEVDILLAWLSANEHRYEALITLAVATGMRLGELLALTWADLDLESKKPTVTVQRSVDFINRQGHVVQEPKSKGGRRSIRIAPDTVRVLHVHHARQLRRQAEAVTWSDKNLVFCGPSGCYLAPSGVWRMFQRILDYAGLPAIRFHDLRHTAATLMLLYGMKLTTLMRVLGHSDIKTTMRYLHFIPAMEEEDMQQFNDGLFAERRRA